MTVPDPSVPTDAACNPAIRQFGRFELREVVGRSQRTMAWFAHDPQVARDLFIVMPRMAPANADGLGRWEQAALRAARLNHPNLAQVVEIGACDGWPFVAYDPAGCTTLAARIGTQGLAARDAAAAVAQAGQGLAFAHDAGTVHGDVQPFLLLLSDSGHLRVMGFEVALDAAYGAADGGIPAADVPVTDARRLRAQRAAARRDVFTLALVLHQALGGQAALDETDTGEVVLRMAPSGRDIVRLPWSTPRPVPEPLRAIVNRGTERQERQRYRGARTLVSALEGWLASDSISGGGPLALLLDRLHSVGVLPASPGGASRAARLALMERERTNELAEVVLEDVALAFEMLRAVNTAQVRGMQISGSGPVLTVRRAIAMLGLDGVRQAALALRPWPGPLDERGALALQRLIQRVRRAGEVAQMLRPAGYDSEVVCLVAQLQNLGRLVVQYHFAGEAVQIRALMKPAQPDQPGERPEPGMSEDAASFAVLGVDVETIGNAVARHWGLDGSVLHMIRRLSVATPVRSIDTDDDMLRAVGSCANEAIDALAQPASQVGPALARVAQRYGRALNITLRDLQAALTPAAGARGNEEPTTQTTDTSVEDTLA